MGTAGDKTADDSRQTLGHGVLLQVLMQVAQDGHLLHFRWYGGDIRIDGVVIMGDAEIRIGSDQRFIQHLLLLIAHIGDQ